MRLLFIVLAYLFYSYVHAQSDESYGTWTSLRTEFKVDNKWTLLADAGLRHFATYQQFQQILVRSYALYTLHPLAKAGMGYAFVYNEDFLDFKSLSEQRIFQEAVSTHPFYFFKMTHRLRLEERFMDQDFFLRGRYLLSAQMPLYSPNKENAEHSLYAKTNNEILLHLNKSHVFDQFRIQVGLGFNATKYMSCESLYMYQLSSTTHQNVLLLISKFSF